MQKAIDAKMASGLICWRDETRKQCLQCKEIKPLTEFPRKGPTWQPRCRICDAIFCYERYQKQTEELKEKVFDALGRVCSCCGESEPAFLTLDHVGGGGKEHRKKLSKYNALYRDVLASVDSGKYRILCMNCNWAIRFGKQCPHQSKKLVAVGQP